MYEVSIRAHFSSAHDLRGYSGKCEALHGHNWEVEITVRSPELGPVGLVVDFKQLKEWAGEVMDGLDHRYLNELEPFRTLNPSSENLAKYIFDEMCRRIPAGSATMASVRVWESPGSCATYSAA